MRFCFYSGYRDLKGGYTTLVLTLIKELYRQKQEVVLLNFTNGLFADELRKANVHIDIIDLDTVNWKEIDKKIFPTDLFIITKFVEPYHHLLKINPRVIYFDINDFICQISDYKFGLTFPSLGKKLIKELLAKNSLIFMDDTGIFNLKNYFSLDVNSPVFLPIPVTVPGENAYVRKDLTSDDSIHLTYIGRSVDWKMMPLKKILHDASRAGIKKKISFSIVVDSLSDLKKFINLEEYKNDMLEITVTENMPPSQINDFLIHNADLHFAMGTAALDAAKLGIPTIVVDYSAKEFPDNYGYKWLYDTTGFSLGRNLEKIPPTTGMSMEALLHIAAEPGKLKDHSERSYAYVLNNHSVENIITRLIPVANNAKFRMNDARNLIPFYFKAHSLVKKTAALFTRKGTAE